jgi:hypothetical protein
MEIVSSLTVDGATLPSLRVPVQYMRSGVKWTPKPDPVKRRPPTSRRFYFTEPAVPWMYIFVTSHVLAHVANAPPVAAYPRYPPRHFVSFSLGRSDCPPRVSIPSFPGLPPRSPQSQRLFPLVSFRHHVQF